MEVPPTPATAQCPPTISAALAKCPPLLPATSAHCRPSLSAAVVQCMLLFSSPAGRLHRFGGHCHFTESRPLGELDRLVQEEEEEVQYPDS
jgi:hypothetical protein